MAPTVYVVYYSLYGHVYKLAKEVVAGLEAEGVEVKLFQIAETLPEEVLEKMHAPPKQDVPVLAPKDLAAADGFVFGFPTRFGGMVSQVRAFWDATGGLWTQNALHGKPFGVFTSTASQGGGQENTISSSLSTFVHHGMVFKSVGYKFGAELYDLKEVRGGSAWGAGTFAGADGSRQPTDLELRAAKFQGTDFGLFIKRLHP